MKPASSKAPAGLPGTQLLATLNKSERRSSLRMYKHWEAARGAATLPRLADFDLSLLEELGDACFLLMVGSEEVEPRFRYFGRDLMAQAGRDLTGRVLSDAPTSSLLARVLGHYVEATQRQKPVGISGRFQAPGGELLLYRGILLPFASEEGEVEAVLGCYRWRTARQAARAMPEQAGPTAGALLLGPDELKEKCRPGKIQALKSLVSKAAWPSKTLSKARSAPSLGRAVVRLDGPASEFVLLLARRSDPQSDRFDVISASGPLLLNLALRQAVNRLTRAARPQD
jgi:hypothetical protein